MTPPLPQPHEGLNAAVAAQLRAERAAAQLKIEDLVSATDISDVSVRRYLNAKRHIDVTTLHALATALGTTATEVVIAAQKRLNASNELSERRDRRAEMQQIEDLAARDEDDH